MIFGKIQIMARELQSIIKFDRIESLQTLNSVTDWRFKMKSKKWFVLKLTVLALLIVLGYALLKSHQLNRHLREALPYYLVGEEIDYFDIIDMDEKSIDRNALKGDRPSLIFIFSRPCSPCNKNIVFWQKMAEVLKGKVSVYGIILANVTEAYNFSQRAGLNFKIYVPQDIDTFIEKMRIKMNVSQTIVYNGTVRLVKLGNMEGEEAVSVIKLIKDSV